MKKEECDKIKIDIGKKEIVLYFKNLELLQKFILELYSKA